MTTTQRTKVEKLMDEVHAAAEALWAAEDRLNAELDAIAATEAVAA